MIWWVCSVMLSSPSNKRGTSPLPSSSSWTHIFMQSEFNITETKPIQSRQPCCNFFNGWINERTYPSWEVILLFICRNETRKNGERVHTLKERTNQTAFHFFMFKQATYILKQCCSACEPTQISHDPSSDGGILTVLLQVNYKWQEMLKEVSYLNKCVTISKSFLCVLPILGSITSSMLGTGVGSSMSLVRSSSCSSSCCPRLLLCKYTQKTVLTEYNEILREYNLCIWNNYLIPLLSFLPAFRGERRGGASSLFDGVWVLQTGKAAASIKTLNILKMKVTRVPTRKTRRSVYWSMSILFQFKKKKALQLHTNLLISELNAPTEKDWNVLLIHTIVFLVHPFVENICVQNPTSMDLGHTHTVYLS